MLIDHSPKYGEISGVPCNCLVQVVSVHAPVLLSLSSYLKWVGMDRVMATRVCGRRVQGLGKGQGIWGRGMISAIVLGSMKGCRHQRG